MNKKALLLLIPVFALCSCKGEPKCLSERTQEYSTYQQMIDAEAEYQKVHLESEKTLFTVSFDNFKSEKFFIGGIDYCPLYAKDSLHTKDQEYCPHMLNRELYSETSFDSTQIVTIIYKSKCNYDLDTLNWISSDGGPSCYRYEGNFISSEQYILTDKNDNYVVGLKLLVSDDEFKAIAFAKVIDAIKAL